MKTPTRAVRFAVAERLSHLDAATWDGLAARAGVFMQRGFLTAFEAAMPDNVSPRYALMYLGDEPLAALHFHLVRIEGRSALPVTGVAQFVDERALVLGNLAAWGDTGIAMVEGADQQLVWREALRLVDRLRRFEKSEGAINVAFIKDAHVEEDERVLRQQGYQRAPSGPDMVLTCDASWNGFDDYLASLASKRRRAVKKIHEELEAAGYRVQRLSLTDLMRNEARLDALYGQVWANADVRPLRLSGRFFVELQRRLGDDCVMTGLFKGDSLDGFGVSLKSEETCVGYYLGFDKSVDAPLYLRLLVSIIEAGTAWRCVRISMGRTAEEPKARLGAVPGVSGLWVKHRTPPLNWAVGAVLGSLQQPTAPTYRVFREDTLKS